MTELDTRLAPPRDRPTRRAQAPAIVLGRHLFEHHERHAQQDTYDLLWLARRGGTMSFEEACEADATPTRMRELGSHLRRLRGLERRPARARVRPRRRSSSRRRRACRSAGGGDPGPGGDPDPASGEGPQARREAQGAMV